MVYLPSECSKASNIHFPFLSCRVAWVVADASDFSRLYVPHTSMSTASGWGQNSTESAGHSVFSLNLDMVETGRVIIEENRDAASEIRLSVSMKHKGVRGFWRSQSRVCWAARKGGRRLHLTTMADFIQALDPSKLVVVEAVSSPSSAPLEILNLN